MTSTPEESEYAVQPEVLSVSAVKSRAVRGVLLIGGRTVVIRGIGLLSNLVLARLLTPEDFGLVAIGAVVLMLSAVLSDAGVGAALLRRPHAPSRAEYESVVGFQLALTMVVVLLVAAFSAFGGGEQALITLVMVMSLPLTAWRAPGAIALERALNYGPVIKVDIVETLVYSVGCVALVFYGLGVWGIAVAQVLRAAAGTGTMAVVSPIGLLRPRLNLTLIRSYLGFGIRFQMITLVGLGRDQGMNVMAGSIAGLAQLGFWSLAYRLLQVPMMVFETLRRVSYPGMARLVEMGEDPRPIVQRSLALCAVGSALILSAFGACAPSLVPFLFGDTWNDAALPITLVCVGLAYSAPYSVAAAGYLLAVDSSEVVLRIVTLHTVASLAVAGVALPFLGVAALGLGYVAIGLVDIVLFSRELRKRIDGIRPIAAVVPAVVATQAAGVLGWFVATELAETALLGVVASLAVALGLGLLFSAVVAREAVSRLTAIASSRLRRT